MEWLRADLLAGIEDRFDALLANLPYVAAPERGSLAPEIARHEPPLALFAGPDGLAVIRALVAQLAARPRLELVALEVGSGQARAVAGMIAEAGFGDVSALVDLAGLERVVVGRRDAERPLTLAPSSAASPRAGSR